MIDIGANFAWAFQSNTTNLRESGGFGPNYAK